MKNNYKDKYLKYKNKYLKFKKLEKTLLANNTNELTGGMSTFLGMIATKLGDLPENAPIDFLKGVINSYLVKINNNTALLNTLGKDAMELTTLDPNSQDFSNKLTKILNQIPGLNAALQTLTGLNVTAMLHDSISDETKKNLEPKLNSLKRLIDLLFNFINEPQNAG